MPVGVYCVRVNRNGIYDRIAYLLNENDCSDYYNGDDYCIDDLSDGTRYSVYN